jgi:hypothetical protein
MNTINIKAVILISIIFLVSCKKVSNRSFYYWKSTYQTTSLEREYLEKLKISKLYIKFFDVSWDESSGKAIPEAKIIFKDSTYLNYEVIPVVYITNKTLHEIKQENIAELSSNIFNLVKNLALSNKINFNELQIDCDWSDKTRNKYFGLLKYLKADLRKTKTQLSATIRLHQIKYKNITGIPPVDRGMLMFYNMGKLEAGNSLNSIFNSKDAEKYLKNKIDYPIPLDAVLPAFSWGVHERDDEIIELLNNIDIQDFQKNNNFKSAKHNIYVAENSFFFRGSYFMKNDNVKIEEILPSQSIEAARLLNKSLERKVNTIAIFHLDSLIFTKYEKEDFAKVFNTFN